jgi:hypothetical protein
MKPKHVERLILKIRLHDLCDVSVMAEGHVQIVQSEVCFAHPDFVCNSG